MREIWVQSMGQEDPLEMEIATRSSTPAWKIPWMEEPGRLQFTVSQRVGHSWVTSLSLSFTCLEIYTVNAWTLYIFYIWRTKFTFALYKWYTFYSIYEVLWASQVALVVKNLPANSGDLREVDSIPGLGRSPGRGHGNPLQYSCLENPMDRGS